MEVDNASRYRSRILREMNANRNNPFNSPPSSTGSHGTASPTMSSVFTDPEGESTRRLNEDIARITGQRKLSVNFEAAHRKWPEFYSLPKDRVAADDTTNPTPMKENKPPVRFTTRVDSKHIDDESTRDVWKAPSTRPRSEMQARVDDTDFSVLSKSPGVTPQRALPNSKDLNLTPAPFNPSPLAHARSYSSAERKTSSSYHAAVDSLRRTSAGHSPNQAADRQSNHDNSPHMSSARSSLTAVPPSPESVHQSNSPAQNQPSFVMPDVSHLEDFVTGTLRFAGSVQNGVPIFVKNGRVHDRRDKSAQSPSHVEVDAFDVPEDEEKIFVSMDMIRQEILELRDHNDKIQEYAYSLQQQVESLERQVATGNQTPARMGSSRVNEQLLEQNNELETEVASLQIRLEKASRKASNNDHLTEHNHRLEAEVASLQSRLEQAARKLSLSEIENDSLTQEKDRAVRKLQEACEDINKLTHKLSSKKKEYETTHRHQMESTEQMRQDCESLRREISSLQQGRDSLEVENVSLREENESLRQTVEELQNRPEPKLFDDMTSQSRGHSRSRSQSQKKSQRARSQSRVSRTSRASHQFTETVDMDETVDSDTGADDVEQSAPLPRQQQQQQQQEKTENLTNNRNKLRNDTVQSLWMPPTTETDFMEDKTTESRPEFVEIDDEDESLNSGDCRPIGGDPKRQAPQQPAEEDTTQQSKKKQPQQKQSAMRSRSRSQSRSRASAHVKRTAFAADLTTTTEADNTRTTAAGGAGASTVVKDSCPTLSAEARRILDGLCEHNCRNCTVCSRISHHRGMVSATDVSRGKKRVTIPRPVAVSDRSLAGVEDPTMRPAQPPGHALALVIKGLEDEAQHLQLELTRLQARYNASDKAVGRRERVRMAEDVRALLRQLEAKDDQVYCLYDVLEGQKVAGQEMTEEEMEKTVYDLTGVSVRDVTETWEGIEA